VAVVYFTGLTEELGLFGANSLMMRLVRDLLCPTLMAKSMDQVALIGRAVALTLLVVTLPACAKGRNGPSLETKPPAGPHTLKKLSVAERQQAMERANVWRSLNTSSLNIVKGPNLPAKERVPGQVTCTYVHPDKPLNGDTPKFLCDLGDGDVVKVKYGEKNGEVYAEVAGTRLLWALGFQADVMYPTKVTCRNCPADPFLASNAEWERNSPKDVANRVYDPAVIERASGKSIEVAGYNGWAWPELDKIGTSPGGATRAQLDALKLIAVFMQHSDSKPEQQEIVCDDGKKQKDDKGNETCAVSWLVIKDLGVTFGKATRLNSSKMNLADWESMPIWKDAKQCIGDMPRSMTGSLEDPKISEAGRRFLSDRLMQLSDRQITDIFRVSNVMRRQETIAGADGHKRPVAIDDWVRVFKKKRAEITSAHCAA